MYLLYTALHNIQYLLMLCKKSQCRCLYSFGERYQSLLLSIESSKDMNKKDRVTIHQTFVSETLYLYFVISTHDCVKYDYYLEMFLTFKLGRQLHFHIPCGLLFVNANIVKGCHNNWT